jgi:Cft2 family RNA processing exonuclease
VNKVKYYLGYDPEQKFESFIQNLKQRKNTRGNSHKKYSKRESDIEIGKSDGKSTIEIDNIKIALDCWDRTADLIFISHAHMDHIPNIPSKAYKELKKGNLDIKFLCSKITKEIAESRTQGKFRIPENAELRTEQENNKIKVQFNGISVQLIENGHTFGSTSLFIEGSQTILYTGDFITGRNINTKSKLSPINCDYLITECTYGSPHYKFPPFENLKRNINNYITKQIAQNHPVILLCYSFGKSQNLLKILDPTFNVILERTIANNTRILEQNDITFPEWKPYGNFNKNILSKRHDYVLLLPPYNIFREPYRTLVSVGGKVAMLSGKVFNREFRETFAVDKYFPFSDHCDFYQLEDFIKYVHPKRIYLEHGTVNEFSYYLRQFTNLPTRIIEVL